MVRSGKKVSIGSRQRVGRSVLWNNRWRGWQPKCASSTETTPPRRRESPAAKLKLLPARLKALRLYGRYLGYMRQLKSRAKAEVRDLRARKGVKAAIKRARKLAGG
jgi:hypothetical protein